MTPHQNSRALRPWHPQATWHVKLALCLLHNVLHSSSMSDILATSTPVRFPFFMLTINPKHKKWNHSSDSAPDDLHGKRAHAKIKESNVSSRCSTSTVQPEARSGETVLTASHSFNLPEPKLIDLPFSPVKGATDPTNGFTVEALESTRDHGRDFTMGVSKDDINPGGDEPNPDSDSLESAADSGHESATGDCLTCSDTEEAAVKSAHKKFHEQV